MDLLLVHGNEIASVTSFDVSTHRGARAAVFIRLIGVWPAVQWAAKGPATGFQRQPAPALQTAVAAPLVTRIADLQTPRVRLLGDRLAGFLSRLDPVQHRLTTYAGSGVLLR